MLTPLRRKPKHLSKKSKTTLHCCGAHYELLYHSIWPLWSYAQLVGWNHSAAICRTTTNGPSLLAYDIWTDRHQRDVLSDDSESKFNKSMFLPNCLYITLLFLYYWSLLWTVATWKIILRKRVSEREDVSNSRFFFCVSHHFLFIFSPKSQHS